MKKPAAAHAAAEPEDSMLAPLDGGAPEEERSSERSWPARAARLGAKPTARDAGLILFSALWKTDGNDQGLALSEDEQRELAEFLEFARLPAGAELIAQDEAGDFLVILLEGRIGVEHLHPSGERPRLAEARPGDMLGEMSLLDAGSRSSTCTTRTPCLVAVLEARRLQEMMQREPRLALAVVASLARRLSLRLREVNARLSALLSGA